MLMWKTGNLRSRGDKRMEKTAQWIMETMGINMADTSAEKPLERILNDGGLCGIFRTIGCIGDSLSSGEFESMDETGQKGYHDYYEYSWGQYMARTVGCKVYNFSRGGMTAREYCETFADENDFWNPEKKCQAYIIALGVNDVTQNGEALGDISDIDPENYKNNKKTFVGYYGQIIQRMKEIQPKAKFFLMTIPSDRKHIRNKARDRHAELIYEMAQLFENTYVLDFRKYAVEYDDDFKKLFFLGTHMNAAGYLLTSKLVISYIDYIIRHNMEDFKQIGFVGTPYHYIGEKW